MTVYGYIREYCPDHPMRDVSSMVAQHRLVMEGMIGRLLDRDEVVHHKNGMRNDNRPENLELMSLHAHGQHHADASRKAQQAPLTDERVRKALEGRTTAEAATLLGVSVQTLHNRFYPLLRRRKSPGGQYDAQLVERVRAFAQDPLMGTIQAAAELRMTQWRIRKICAQGGFAWVSAPTGTPSHYMSKLRAQRQQASSAPPPSPQAAPSDGSEVSP